MGTSIYMYGIGSVSNVLLLSNWMETLRRTKLGSVAHYLDHRNISKPLRHRVLH